jgi:hypothetical protein
MNEKKYIRLIKKKYSSFQNFDQKVPKISCFARKLIRIAYLKKGLFDDFLLTSGNLSVDV